MANDQVLIIGAGPFGLSLSAHLRSMGVEHRIVGKTMDTWRRHMPSGMNLRSEPYGSAIAAPEHGFDVANFCRLHGLDYVDRLGPLSVERFLQYADWYAHQLVPDVEDITVANISLADGGFHISFVDNDSTYAQTVVLATGILPYAYVPPELLHLPSDLLSHTSNHHRLDTFSGKRVALIGSGQSALETAALLHEAGADVLIITRSSSINWIEPNRPRVSLVGHLRRPVNRLCEGWKCTMWNTPFAFRRLPESVRMIKARTALGPAGAWWLKDRVKGVIEVLFDHQIRDAVPRTSGVTLTVDGPKRTIIDVDHVIAGTGFRIDVSRLDLLSETVQNQIQTLNGHARVDKFGESTSSGLYFAGAPAAVNLGPSVRFIAGTHNTTIPLARSLARRVGIAGSRPPSDLVSTSGLGPAV
jgi:FAD-dependent urate hydroxylase